MLNKLNIPNLSHFHFKLSWSEQNKNCNLDLRTKEGCKLLIPNSRWHKLSQTHWSRLSCGSLYCVKIQPHITCLSIVVYDCTYFGSHQTKRYMLNKQWVNTDTIPIDYQEDNYIKQLNIYWLYVEGLKHNNSLKSFFVFCYLFVTTVPNEHYDYILL